MALVTRLGYEIVNQAVAWVTPESICTEDYINGHYVNTSSCIDTVYNTYYGKENVTQEAYCTIFAWIVIDGACKSLGLENILPKSTGGAYIFDKVKKDGSMRVDGTPAVGSFMRRKSPASDSGWHSGIVVKVDNDRIYTIEGNSSFNYAGNKYEGIWGHSYTWDDVSKQGMQFCHTEEMYGTDDTLEVNYDVSAFDDGSTFTILGISPVGIGIGTLLLLGTGIWAYNKYYAKK
ncbi:MAG: CHAP domain-containing protein [Candidatus Kapabacteria bacterium]|nr:CHAP domain-containing protein [Candidatus Kapabacteria bacterium]